MGSMCRNRRREAGDLGATEAIVWLLGRLDLVCGFGRATLDRPAPVSSRGAFVLRQPKRRMLYSKLTMLTFSLTRRNADRAHDEAHRSLLIREYVLYGRR